MNEDRFNEWAKDFLSVKRTRKTSNALNIITLILAIIVIILLLARRTYAGDLKLVKATGYCQGEIGSHGDKMKEGYCAYKPESYGSTLAVYMASEHGNEFIIGDFIGYYEVRDTGFGTETGQGKSKIIKGKTIGTIEGGSQVDFYHHTFQDCVEFMKRTQGQVFIMEVSGEG